MEKMNGRRNLAFREKENAMRNGGEENARGKSPNRTASHGIRKEKDIYNKERKSIKRNGIS